MNQSLNVQKRNPMALYARPPIIVGLEPGGSVLVISDRGGARLRSARNYGRADGQNPLGPDGQVSRCAICGSLNHWVRNCPNSYDSK